MKTNGYMKIVLHHNKKDNENNQYASGTKPKVFSMPIFIALSKNVRCEWMRAPLYNQLNKLHNKLIIWILMNRTRSSIKSEIEQELCGFLKEKRIPYLWSKRYQREEYFEDCAKAFYKLQYIDLFKLTYLGKLLE